MIEAADKATPARIHASSIANMKLAWLIIAVVAVVSPPVRADVVAARSHRPLVNTQVLRLDAGRLIYEGEGGQEVSAPVEKVEYLQITGWQMFNLAEKQRRREDWRRAAVSYERALADLQIEEQTGEPAAGRRGDLDRALLVKCRLISAWDAQRRFDRAVELYLELIAGMPEVLDALRPLNFPETGSEVLDIAARKVDGMIARRGNDEIARSLHAWRATWPVRPTASSPDNAAGRAARGIDRRSRERIGRIAGLVESGRLADALALIDESHKQTPGGLRADLFYWQGRAFESLHAAKAAAASDAPAGPPATQPADPALVARAGMAYMRVVVHFPLHPLAAESLYRAAHLARLSGQREQAAAMWAELIGTYPLAQTSKGELWADKAREELK